MKWSSIHCNLSFWLPACLLFFSFSSSAFSATCQPGELTSTPTVGFYFVAGLTDFKYPSASTACSMAASVDKFWGNGKTGSGSGTGPTACTVTNESDGSTHVVTSISFASGTCPTNFIQDGSICVNTCTPEEPCPAADTKISEGFTTTSTGASSCYETSSGTKCAVSHGDLITSTNPDTGITTSWVSTGRYTGSNCTTVDTSSSPNLPVSVQVTPVNNPPKSATDCPGGAGFAQINNTAMCLPSGTTIKDTPTITTSTSGSTSSQTTTVINNNGTSTTTTTTTYRDSNGNITFEGTSTGTGSLNQAGTGTGNDKPLDLGTAPTFDDTLPGEAAFTPKIQGNPTFSTTIFEVAASCPAPITFEVFSQEFTISFQPICDLSTIIRGIILMLSGIVALRAVVSGGN